MNLKHVTVLLVLLAVLPMRAGAQPGAGESSIFRLVTFQTTSELRLGATQGNGETGIVDIHNAILALMAIGAPEVRNLAYIPANVMSTVYIAKHEVFDETKGGFKTVGGGEGYYRPAGAQRSGTLTAMDPTTNTVVWQKATKWPLGSGGGLLSTAGGLIFHGEPDGHLVARDIRNGEELWRFQTGAGANAPASTFEVDGEQYVAILSGGNRLLLSQPGDYVWAFKLGGTVPPAPTPREPPTTHPDTGQEQAAPQPVQPRR